MFAQAVAFLHSLASSAAFAYATILALQLKVLWGLWLYKDLESGDTTYYFMNATMWHTRGLTVFSWSPLYTTFFGSMFNLSNDAYAATIAHRLVLVLSLALLVLALLRRLLSPLIAWLMAVWWVVLPINFDAVYSVHLFAMIPILLACLAVAWCGSRWIPGSLGRGGCLGILFGSAVLMRNELAIPFAFFGAACVIYEIRSRREIGRRRLFWKLCHYCVPVLLAAGLSLFFYMRASDRGSIKAVMWDKHTLNVCQIYASGYRQRHPEWINNPWTECQGLMEKTFGKPQLPLTEAVLRNPGAMFEHFAWNFSLLPNGVQILLFNAMSGTVNPDYLPVHIARFPVLAASFLLAGIWILGLVRSPLRWTYWWERIQPRAWIWMALFSFAPMCAFIVATQRPRPSYLFSLSVLIMAITGLLVESVLGPAVLSRSKTFAPLIVAAVLIVTPRYYYNSEHQSPRTLLSYYRALKPFAARLGPGQVILMPGYGYAGELCNRFSQPQTPPCGGLDYHDYASLREILARKKVNLVYVDEPMLQEKATADFAETAVSQGWNCIALRLVSGNRSMLFERAPTAP